MKGVLVSGLVTIFSLLIIPTAQGQFSDDDGGIETESGFLRYIETGAGATYRTLLDETIAPVLYEGVGPVFTLGHIKVSKNTYSELTAQGSVVNLKYNVNDLLQTNVNIQKALLDYRYMIVTPVSGRGYDLKGGVLLSAMGAHKNVPHMVDAADMYEYALSIGISARITQQIYLFDKTGFLIWDMSLPVFSYVSGPSYLNIVKNNDPEYNPLTNTFDNAETGSFGKYLRWNSRMSYMYRLENGNTIRIGYQWDYSKIKVAHRALLAEHSLFLTYMFNY